MRSERWMERYCKKISCLDWDSYLGGCRSKKAQITAGPFGSLRA